MKRNPADSDRRLKAIDKASQLKEKLPPPPAIVIAAEKTVGRQFGGFVTFIREQGVIGLAVGIVLGGAVSVMVKSLIDNVVMPPLGFLLGSGSGLRGVRFPLGKAADGTAAYLNVGTFLNDFINFLIIALVIYLVIHLLGLDKIDKKKQ